MYSVGGEAVVEVYVKPKASGRVLVKIVAECSGVKSSKLFSLNVEKNALQRTSRARSQLLPEVRS